MITFKVISVQKQPDLTFTISYQTDNKYFNHQSQTINRTLSEVCLLMNYFIKEIPESITPAIPPKSNDLLFLKSMLQQFLDRLSKHEKLLFTQESEFQFVAPKSPPPIQKKQRSFFSLSEQKIKDVDIFFDLALNDVQVLQQYLSGIGRMNEKVGQQEVQLIKTIDQLIPKLNSLKLDQLRKLLRYYSAYMTTLSNATKYRSNTFTDQLVLLLQQSSIAKNSLEYRLTLLENYEYCCKATQKKVVQMEKLKQQKQIKQEKVDAHLEELAQIKKQENEAKILFKDCSTFLKEEFDDYRSLEQWIKDVAKSLKLFTKMQLRELFEPPCDFPIKQTYSHRPSETTVRQSNTEIDKIQTEQKEPILPNPKTVSNLHFLHSYQDKYDNIPLERANTLPTFQSIPLYKTSTLPLKKKKSWFSFLKKNKN
ncbi:hypothetical protein HDV06_004405 [Boothiomyces sp. JEL0866]|nr:hypothetical protein HDV06_004405 [Boothiomyces sp. JEL0866]